ncbi:biotin/lipoyl-containing protein [Marinobacterium arenosum]|uniref:biotin/lipoyl-containing protein n=1 Tax=Marinobacterium arenosum TaxID=2862496 RepID=UPI001C956303|nr:biotin/lipoyl-containing protein [Marinobacterium arenosum]MBY4675024.1 biotin attachment protein [Marinobacterium arenosum]
MSTEVRVPENLWDEDNEAVITAWLASDGGQVEQGEVIAELMVEKIQYELEAPASGTLQIGKDVDEVVAKGDLVGQIG